MGLPAAGVRVDEGGVDQEVAHQQGGRGHVGQEQGREYAGQAGAAAVTVLEAPEEEQKVLEKPAPDPGKLLPQQLAGLIDPALATPGPLLCEHNRATADKGPDSRRPTRRPLPQSSFTPRTPAPPSVHVVEPLRRTSTSEAVRKLCGSTYWGSGQRMART
jgi:hypothetical protein